METVAKLIIGVRVIVGLSSSTYKTIICKKSSQCAVSVHLHQKCLKWSNTDLSSHKGKGREQKKRF